LQTKEEVGVQNSSFQAKKPSYTEDLDIARLFKKFAGTIKKAKNKTTDYY